MNYLAFDVSGRKLDGVFTNLRTKTEYFTIPNEPKKIISWLASASFPKKITMGCEATGRYHLELAKACIRAGYVFKVINPILTKQFTKATIRKKKTDRSDSLIIAKLLAQGEGYVFVDDPLMEKVKREHRHASLIARYKQGLGLCLQGDPGDKHLKAVLTAMEQAQKERDTELRETYRHNPDCELLESIRGIGWKSAFAIWSEIGSIKKFNHPKQLIAYTGLDPKIRQSGRTLNSQGKLTKRGSPYLRHAIFVAANCARIHDPELKAYYWKKRGEGKKHTVAVCATARKLINRIYAVWSRGTPFIPLLAAAT